VLKFLKKTKGAPKTKTSRPAAPARQAVSSDSGIQHMVNILQKSKSRACPVLLAASRLSDLPVTIPINLAVSLSQTGKCLLIDFDSKRDALAKVFDVDSSRIEPHLKITPVETAVENLSIWPARYFDLVKQMNLRLLLASAQKKYDHILLYAPYLTVLADRKQIASCSKQAIVFGKDSDAMPQMQRLLKMCACNILLEA